MQDFLSSDDFSERMGKIDGVIGKTLDHIGASLKNKAEGDPENQFAVTWEQMLNCFDPARPGVLKVSSNLMNCMSNMSMPA